MALLEAWGRCRMSGTLVEKMSSRDGRLREASVGVAVSKGGVGTLFGPGVGEGCESVPVAAEVTGALCGEV